MTMIKRFFRYIRFLMDTNAKNGPSLQRIHYISLTVLAFEAMVVILFSLSSAGRIETLNLLLLAFTALLAGTVLYLNQRRVSAVATQLEEYNRTLNDASCHDSLTGLLNRMALEADARRMDGRNMTAYMIDINYFKEINDQYGHLAGDAMLRETGEILKHLFPGARCYRYGGDEFLVLSSRPVAENYQSDTYAMRPDSCGAKLLLSIGNAQGAPETYEDLFALISRADKALYAVKERTHSPEYGGHDRRKSDRHRETQGKNAFCA